jgi:uncharacterized repeat protein (TIGR01451 family)
VKSTSLSLQIIFIAAGCAALFALLFTVQMGGVRAQSSIIYVDADAPGANDGSSWSDAYTSLQTALGAAASGDEIWVAEGTYKPTTGSDRYATFDLKDGVAIYGGFGGYGISETLCTQRDWVAHPVVLSGDIGAVGDGSDNVYHVVSIVGVIEPVVLDGFTITGGNAIGSGGGMYNDHSDPTLTNITFSGNAASSYGGGMYSSDGDPTLTNITFSGNAASSYGGGMYNGGGDPTLTNVTFSGNTASQDGGGMYSRYGGPTLTNVTFNGNTASQDGGGVYNYYGDSVLTNCILWDNTPTSISGAGVIVRHSLVQYGYGGYPDVHNIHANPQFVDADGPDDIPGTPDDDLRLRVNSPAIDAGDSTALPGGVTTDLGGNPRLVDVLSVPDTGSSPAPTVDMGAYEADPDLWLVKSGTPVFPAPGDTMTYTLTFANDAASTATGVVITDVVPNQLSEVSYQSSGAILTQVGSTDFVWQVATLAPGEGGTITITGIISPGLTGPLSFTNTAVITAAVADVDPSDNEGSVHTFIPGVIYVDKDAPGAGTGLSWTDAFTTVQAALDAAALTPAGDEIWVAGAVYTPTNAVTRTATFALPDGAWLYGGFGGYGISETLRLERDWMVHPTTLSGDIGAAGDGSDNAYHVISIASVTGTVILDGFTITGGNADGGSDLTNAGGGVHTSGDEVFVTNVTLSGNSAQDCGGGVYNAGNAMLTDVTLDGNHAVEGWGADAGAGGGMWNSGTVVLERVSFTGNQTMEGVGGGMWNGGTAVLERVSFTGNHADNSGGGMQNGGAVDVASNAILAHVTFSGNSAAGGAGGMGNSTDAILEDVVFEGNSAGVGGGMANVGIATLTRVVFRDNWTTCDPRFARCHSGGGLYFNGRSLTLTNVTFEANRAGLYGGGMCNYYYKGEPELVNVVFEGNIAGQSGGGMYNASFDGGNFSPRLVNVHFSGNQADNSGGGMFNYNASPELHQATFSGNVAQLGGGMYNYGDGIWTIVSRPTIYNSIFWHNQDQNGTGPLAQIYDDAPFAMSTITYSLVEGGCPPAGDASTAGSTSTCSDLLSADPLFVRAPDPGDGDWATSADNDYGDLGLRTGSPAIDAGDAAAIPPDTLDLDGDHDLAEPLSLDLAGNPRIQHGVVDMGAYEAILFAVYLPLVSGD